MIGRFKLAGVVALAATMSLTGAYQLGKHNQRQQTALSAAQAVSKAIQHRAGINETINNMDGVALCLELGGVRDQCEQLRGLGKDQR